MSIRLVSYKVGEVAVVSATGRLTLGEGTSALRTKIRELVDGGSRRVQLKRAEFLGAAENGRSLGLIDVAAGEPDLYKDSQPVLGPSDNKRLVRGCYNTAFRSGLGRPGDLAVRVDNIEDVIETDKGCICHDALFDLWCRLH